MIRGMLAVKIHPGVMMRAVHGPDSESPNVTLSNKLPSYARRTD
jgi:hypothetical protein